MHDYQNVFIELALKYEALQFGEFTLKSGRISPYFFNASRFNDSFALTVIGECMAHAIHTKGLKFDGLFGAAYKGIPLIATLSTALYRLYGQNVKISYNRKEAKPHGEGGVMVGASLQGEILVVDDVISAGTAIREVITLTKGSDAVISHALVALDRQEIGPEPSKSTVESLFEQHSLQVHSLIQLDDLLSFVETSPLHSKHLENMNRYRSTYGASTRR